MLKDYLTEEFIQINVECKTWQEAVTGGAEPLLRYGCIEDRYLAKIMENHQTMGAYMVVAPGIMLAHARPEDGAVRLGLSFLTLATPLPFGSELNDPVKLVITLATPDANAHLQLLEALMNFLMQGFLVERLMAAQSTAEALEIIKM